MTAHNSHEIDEGFDRAIEVGLSKIKRNKLEEALKQCIKVLRDWHGHEAFETYYNNAPEMKLIREALPNYKVNG